MPEPKGDVLVKAVKALATQKRDLEAKAKELIDSLNGALRPMGYQVVPQTGNGTGRRRGRPPGSRSARGGRVAKAGQPRKRGRRVMSAAERNAVSRRMKAYWAGRKKSGRKKPAEKKAG